MIPKLHTNVGTWAAIATPFGDLHVAVLEGAIVRTALPGEPTADFLAALLQEFPGITFRHHPEDPLVAAAARQLSEYAAGTRTRFDLPLRPQGTAFQRAVWAQLQEIPHGEVRTYADVAAAVGRPGAATSA